jgi:hypothetical protein
VNIGLIIDTSALLAHLRLERVSIGDLISEVVDGDDLVGVPALAVVDVWAHLDDDELHRLTQMLDWDDSGIVILPLTGDALMDVQRTIQHVTGQGVAHAVVEAKRHGCLLATDRAADIGKALDPDDVVELS